MPPWWKNKYKAPAAFSATNEFLGYIVGDASTPYELVVFNEGLRYVLNLMTGYLCPKLSTPYTNDFLNLYDFQYRGVDLVCGFGDPSLNLADKPVTWNFCKTTTVGGISGSVITHSKVWSGSGWNYVALPPEIRASISPFTFHRWMQVTAVPFSVPFALPVKITVEY